MKKNRINKIMEEAFAKAEVNKEVKEKKERDKRVAQEKEECRKNKKKEQQEKAQKKAVAEQKAEEKKQRNVAINHKMNEEAKAPNDKKLLGFKRSFLASKYVESYFSDMDVIMHPRMEISLDKKDINYEMSIEHQKESTFVRAINKVAPSFKRYGVQGVINKEVEDKNFAFEGKSCLDFITVKMNQNLQGINGNIDLEEQIFTELKKGIFIARDRKSVV